MEKNGPRPDHNNRLIARNALALYSRTIIIMLVSLYTSRLVLNILGIEDFGVYEVVGSVVTVFSFVNLAMTAATQRYLNFELGRGGEGGLRTVFGVSMLIHCAIGLAILLVGETAGLWFLQNKVVIPDGREEVVFWVYQISLFSSIVGFVTVPYNAAIIAREKMSVFAWISVFEAGGKLLGAWGLMFVTFDKLLLYAVFVCFVQVATRVIYAAYCRINFEETRLLFAWNKSLASEMLSFCGWNLFGNIAYVCLTQGTSILLNMFFTPAVNAAKGISAQVQLAVNSFCHNFQVAMNPPLVKSYASGDLEYTRRLIFLGSRLSYYMVMFLSLPIIMETGIILRIWLKQAPEYTEIFVRLSLVASLMQSLANPLVMGNAATGNVKVLMSTVGLMFWMVIPLSYVGLRLGGSPPTVFAVHIGLMIAAHLVRTLIVGRQLGFSLSTYARATLCRAAVVTLLCWIPPYLARQSAPESVWRLLLTTAVAAASVAASAWFAGLAAGERRQIINMYIKRIKR
ncbi:MAG: lipopolysaccharide biosynthesis protein [Tannerellaceae bacterium]|jgi:O-antigen/teichoic acid export membrane protein|nr:lipopolysaccharide biosynthesis protein [Tannerellaceae bacterium]